MNILIKSNKLRPALIAMKKGYQTGDFSEFVSLLAPDCTYQSMWVLETLVGKEAVANHLLGKGSSIKRTHSFPKCSIAQVVSYKEVGEEAADLYKKQVSRIIEELEIEPLLICLKAVQTIDGQENTLLVFLKLNNDQIQSIGLIDANRFETTYTSPCVDFYPGKGDDQDESLGISLSESFLSEFYLFLGITGFDFDEYDSQIIPMDIWVNSLSLWKEFNDAGNFDEIFEKLSGIDYSDWTAKNDFALKRLGQRGIHYWNSRLENIPLVNALIEWSQLIKPEHDCVMTCGY